MALLINPGSGPVADGVEWTNTVERARMTAIDWLQKMHREGMRDVELLDGEEEDEGRWRFTFRHKVTGATVALETHGIDGMDAYLKRHLFEPRVYWNGSSTGTPCIEDWAAEGFEPVLTWRSVEP